MSARPDEAIDVVIEIPTGSRNKYEYDHEPARHPAGPPPLHGHDLSGGLRLRAPTPWPATVTRSTRWCSSRIPPFPGCVVRVRILGMFSMRDEKGVDAKLICVLEHDPQWDGAHDIGDVPEHLRNEIAHFFSIYKDLEPQKSTEVQGFADRASALAELESCRNAYRAVGA